MNSVTKISGLYSTTIVPKISAPQRRKVGNNFYKISRIRWNFIPVDDIESAVAEIGFHLIQEDGTPWSGIFCGREGSCHIQIANEEGNVPNTLISLQWYKIGDRYEINLYLS